MSDYTVSELRIGDNLTITTHYDQNPMSPREYDNLTTIRGWHRRVVIGDGPNIDSEQYAGWDDMIASVIEDEGPLVMLAPLYWYEHSGSSCKMGPLMQLTGDKIPDAESLARFRSLCMDDAGWDSGVAGLVYVTAKSQANMGTPDEMIVEAARGEVETYDQWMRGQVYGYVVAIESECDHGDTHTDVLDSCWGFIGDDEYAMDEGKAHVGCYVLSALTRVIV